MGLIHTAVRENQNGAACFNRLICFIEHVLNGFFQWRIFVIQNADVCCLEPALFHIADLQEIQIAEDWIIDLQDPDIFSFVFQQVPIFSKIYSR